MKTIGYATHNGEPITAKDHEAMFQELINYNSQPLILPDKYQSNHAYTPAEIWKTLDPKAYAKGLKDDWDYSVEHGDIQPA